MVTAGRIDLTRIITHVLPLERFAEAFELLKSGTAVKIVIDVNEAAS